MNEFAKSDGSCSETLQNIRSTMLNRWMYYTLIIYCHQYNYTWTIVQ